MLINIIEFSKYMVLVFMTEKKETMGLEPTQQA